ncbi:hypothetical protein GGTG_12083 [Gaeumannomyces tritici R3-111a-1]|uniref:Uncharacterized protein n=1 Tax=Gaeumannomyces tritici (strain R3-111a-1) TaxID=644352 RepID=J3PF04_GAET3|nr:hypothetical protein GGTG_12083 [Gaeumannomyces tritici R3-111a-1]EJT71062.1 hypothetical protein GGTG_12083 [Gaeumannomyces tritici R3-111a-1]
MSRHAGEGLHPQLPSYLALASARRWFLISRSEIRHHRSDTMRGQLNLLATAALVTSAWTCQHEEDLYKRHSHRKPLARRQEGQKWPPLLSEHETLLVNAFDNVTIDQWANYYGHEVKLAGMGKSAAEWTRDRWTEHGFDAQLNEYHVYLSYPLHASLSFTQANGSTTEVNLVEDVLPEDDVTGRQDNTPTFHGYSASGNVSADFYIILSFLLKFSHLTRVIRFLKFALGRAVLGCRPNTVRLRKRKSLKLSFLMGRRVLIFLAFNITFIRFGFGGLYTVALVKLFRLPVYLRVKSGAYPGFNPYEIKKILLQMRGKPFNYWRVINLKILFMPIYLAILISYSDFKISRLNFNCAGTHNLLRCGLLNPICKCLILTYG